MFPHGPRFHPFRQIGSSGFSLLKLLDALGDALVDRLLGLRTRGLGFLALDALLVDTAARPKSVRTIVLGALIAPFALPKNLVLQQLLARVAA